MLDFAYLSVGIAAQLCCRLLYSFLPTYVGSHFVTELVSKSRSRKVLCRLLVAYHVYEQAAVYQFSDQHTHSWYSRFHQTLFYTLHHALVDILAASQMEL